MFDLIIRNAQIAVSSNQTQIADIGIQNGLITAIAPQLIAESHQTIDAQNKWVSPPFVESHIHLDSVLTAGHPRWNQSGTLFEGIEIWRDYKQTLTLEDVKTRSIAALKQQAQYGVLYVRTHADVSEKI